MGRKKKKSEKPEIHQELKGFNIFINEFGELKSSLDIDKLNTFLNENVEDKKLREQSDEDEK
jgi:hypothetical protein